jgi:hypothetical protein
MCWDCRTSVSPKYFKASRRLGGDREATSRIAEAPNRDIRLGPCSALRVAERRVCMPRSSPEVITQREMNYQPEERSHAWLSSQQAAERGLP